MVTNSDEVALEFPLFFRIYKDGRIERFAGTDTTPVGIDPRTGVQSRDVIIDQETGVSARLYLPKTTTSSSGKVPLLIYFHGGAFCICSPFNRSYHDHVNSVVHEGNVVALSVNYRLAPENPLPIAYDDSWAAVQWAASHSKGNGPEPWLNDHADFSRVYLAGDSAGANLSHNMAIRAAADGLDGVKLAGLVLIHPYFGDNKRNPLLDYLFPTMDKSGDPRIEAADDPKLSTVACPMVLVMVAEKDFLRDRGLTYYEKLKKSGWRGRVDIVEAEGESHVFHLSNPNGEKAMALLKQFVSFME